MRSRTLRAALAALAFSGLSIGATGCGPDAAYGAYVETGPPPPPSEVVIVQPGPDYVWVPGYYNWYGGSYVWVRGTWTVPPSGYRTWVPARWVRVDKGWRLEKGHWKN